MPVVDVDPDELRELTGHDEKSDDELKDDLFNLGLEYEGETEEGFLQLEFAPDRLDRLSVEGVARSLRYQYGDDRGLYVPDTNDADWTFHVDEGGASITYKGVDPEGVSFVPLDSDAEMTPAEVLERHDTGQTYADLVCRLQLDQPTQHSHRHV